VPNKSLYWIFTPLRSIKTSEFNCWAAETHIWKRKMGNKKPRNYTQEDLLKLYLRLNRFFITGFIIHSPDLGKNRTEIDALAIRLQHNAEPERVVD
jgi:hypothetical protein